MDLFFLSILQSMELFYKGNLQYIPVLHFIHAFDTWRQLTPWTELCMHVSNEMRSLPNSAIPSNSNPNHSSIGHPLWACRIFFTWSHAPARTCNFVNVTNMRTLKDTLFLDLPAGSKPFSQCYTPIGRDFGSERSGHPYLGALKATAQYEQHNKLSI